MKELARDARERLLRRRSQLVRLQGGAASEGRSLLEGRSPDWVDQASDEGAASLLANLTERERAEVAEIDAALARIERGTYGVCQSCGGQVEPGRLKAVPEARQCLACSA